MLTEVPVSAFEKPGRDYLQPTAGNDVKGTPNYQHEGNLRD